MQFQYYECLKKNGLKIFFIIFLNKKVKKNVDIFWQKKFEFLKYFQVLVCYVVVNVWKLSIDHGMEQKISIRAFSLKKKRKKYLNNTWD